jgi:phosphoribosyl 1,2-cyclic phosphodiesterase
MKFCVLGSGSRGNSTFIEHGTSRLLIDAGFSGKEIARRLALINRRPEQLSAIIVTHEHGDHISGVGVLSRRFQLPVYANFGTHQAAEKRMGKLFVRQEFSTGQKFTLKGLEIHPFAVSHDTADPVGFVVSNGKQTMGYCTDTGRLTKLMSHLLGKCQGLILEANHDPQMLKDGPYPLPLKQRVQSNRGHLANEDAASFACELVGGALQVLVLAHLSETNNLPELARREMEKKFVRHPARPELLLAMQSNPGPLVDLSLL